MKVEKLKEILQNALDNLEDADENAEIKTVSNTYFLKNANCLISLGSAGYVNLDDPLEDEGDTE
jgi:hypothetical protein